MRHIAQAILFGTCVVAGLVGLYFKVDWSMLALLTGLAGAIWS